LKKDIELLERVQHRVTNMVIELRHLTYEERLQKMDLPAVVYRKASGDVIDTYRYLNSNYQGIWWIIRGFYQVIILED